MILKPLNQCPLLVTPTSFAKYDKNYISMLENTVNKVTYNSTGQPLTEKKLIPVVEDVDGFIAGLDFINANVIRASRNLKVISRYGVGVDRVDLKAAKNAGIFVTNTPGTNSISVAELTIGLAITAARNITEGNIRTKNGTWPRLTGISLSGKTFGIIGLGSIGKEVAKRISGFNMKILAYDVSLDAAFASQYDVVYADLDRVLTSSDFVSLHCPLSKDTANLINKKSLEKIKKGAILINTARGELIDEDALYESICSRHIKAAALDTFREEPPDAKNMLLSLPQVITVPHMGAATDNASNEMTRISIEECFTVLRGEIPKYIVVAPES